MRLEVEGKGLFRAINRPRNKGNFRNKMVPIGASKIFYIWYSWFNERSFNLL